MDWDSVNLLLHDNWVWDFDWDFDWIRNFNFFNDWNFHDLILWDFLVVMFMDCVNWNFDASDMMFTASLKLIARFTNKKL